jgi:Ras-related protein Rab-5C
MNTQIKLVLLGDSGTGKTSIVHRYVNNKYNDENEATIGASFLSKVIELPNDQSIKLQIWDTAGQEKYRSLASMYYKDASAAILVYDITSMKSFEGIKYWANEIKANVPTQVTLAIAANKSDLLEKEEVDIAVGKKFAEESGALFKQTSAKANTGIAELFNDICMKLRPDIVANSVPTIGTNQQQDNRVQPNPQQFDPRKGSIQVDAKKNVEKKKKKECC